MNFLLDKPCTTWYYMYSDDDKEVDMVELGTKIIGKKGLTSYRSYKIVDVPGQPNHVYIDGGAPGRRGATRVLRPWETHGGYDKGHRPMTNRTVRNRLESAMTKLEKSAKLRAISEFSA